MELEKVKISELGKVVTGKTPPTKKQEYYGEKYPFITPTDMNGSDRYIEPERSLSEKGYDYQKNSLLPKNSICFVCIGATIGKICLTNKASFTNQQINSIIPNEEKVDPKFVYYLLSTKAEKIKSIAGGAATPIVNKSSFSGVEVEIPSKETQEKIASILSAFDDLIENNSRRISILEEMARLIYREWFVHYRYPGHENDRLVDSGTDLGDVPEGWEIGTIGDLYDMKSGFAFKSKKLVDQGSFGVIKIGNIQSGDIDVAGVQFIENDKVPEKAVKFKLYPGDVLIAMTGAKVGKVGIMPKTKNPYYLNQRVGKYFSKNEALKSHMYLYAFLNSREAQANIEHLAQGAAQPNISATDLKSLKLPIPPEQILKEFEEFTLSMRDEMLTLRQKNVKLKETRDLLLPKLISGTINID